MISRSGNDIHRGTSIVAAISQRSRTAVSPRMSRCKAHAIAVSRRAQRRASVRLGGRDPRACILIAIERPNAMRGGNRYNTAGSWFQTAARRREPRA